MIKTINISNEIITPDVYKLQINDNPTKIIINIKNCVFLNFISFLCINYIDPLPKQIIINAPKLKYIDNYILINNNVKINCLNKLIIPKKTDKKIIIDEFKTTQEYFNFNRLINNKNIKRLDLKNVKYIFGNFEPAKKVEILISKDNLKIIKKHFKSCFKFKNIKFIIN